MTNFPLIVKAVRATDGECVRILAGFTTRTEADAYVAGLVMRLAKVGVLPLHDFTINHGDEVVALVKVSA